MKKKRAAIDVDKILSRLKEFQRKSVEHIFDKMYRAEAPVHRFLLADEVGLGKTMIARGVIAKAIQHLAAKGVKRIDVVYVCSNLDIARQNIWRLNVTEDEDFAVSSRITLLPREVNNLKGRDINFISFTPGTSFELKSALGIVQERALLFELLDKAWKLRGRGTGPRNLLRGDAGTDTFWRHVDSPATREHDEEIAEAFIRKLGDIGKESKAAGGKDIKKEFLDLCERFARWHEVTPEDREQQRNLIGRLRAYLAETCLDALEPDLIILDEFQRFKHLLTEDSDAGRLAQRLFNFADHQTQARVLLLSATPYKMYTLSQETEEDDHYEDFLSTTRFLLNSEKDSEAFARELEGFGAGLLRPGEEGLAQLMRSKAEIERTLRKVMVRTERLAATTDRDGMLKEVRNPDILPRAIDLAGYMGVQEVSSHLEMGEMMEMWKSAPYLLNFMDDYRVKQEFREHVSGTEYTAGLRKALIQSTGTLLPWNDVRKYVQIDPANARLRALMRDTIESGVWRCLWLPPTLPHYRPGGVFEDAQVRHFTKRLVFSSWRVVPKVIATLLSYEAERCALLSFDKKAKNTPEDRKRRRGLLRFDQKEGRLTGMPLFLLIYPSVTLARLWDNYKGIVADQPVGELPTIGAMVAAFEARVNDIVGLLNITVDPDAPVDERWYWAVPVLADALDASDGKAARAWLKDPEMVSRWRFDEDEEEDGEEEPEEGKHWKSHLDTLNEIIEEARGGTLKLGKPPEDLIAVLAHAALGSPAVCALRSLSAILGDKTFALLPAARIAAAQIGWSMHSLFNQPESMAIVRGADGREPYWLRVLEYLVDGTIQSVFDEFFHILRESEGLIDRKPEDVARVLSRAFRAARGLKTINLGVDDISVSDATRSVSREEGRMRARFALRFGQGKENSESGGEPTREDNVRRAFNSPFWPYVLATTSVGQEGLDFHQYCHAVVHWNLPSNPVDFEQREGRVHRYKGHAVRKNLATKFGSQAIRGDHTNVWNAVFEYGVKSLPDTKGGLLPYWIYPIENGAHVERHVYSVPLSREAGRIEVLKRTLAVYRMVFGQPRQDDLVAFLLAHYPAEEIGKMVEALRMDLGPE
jgi:hypothetical protein